MNESQQQFGLEPKSQTNLPQPTKAMKSSVGKLFQSNVFSPSGMFVSFRYIEECL